MAQEHDDDPDLGPWREPIDDDDGEDGDGECFVALSAKNAARESRSAAVDRWLRMPHHYSLSEYLAEFDAKAASDKEATAENRRTR